MLEEREVDVQKLISVLSQRKIDYCDGVAYIMPESCDEGVDLLNEYAPDIRKDFKERGIESVVVRGEQHNYFALRSADVILPLIFGIPFAIFANFITDWIKENLSGDKTVRVKYIKKDKGKYKEIIVEGTGNEVKDILDSLRDH